MTAFYYFIGGIVLGGVIGFTHGLDYTRGRR